ncbi:hypothetical protein HKD37_10G027606 [Glycine soja]
MANFDVKSIWLLSVFAICVLSLCLYHKMVAAEEDCEEEFRGLNIECYYYMHSGDPTLIFPNDRCCKAITHAYPKLQCVCNILYRKVLYPPGAIIADIINWNKVMYCFSSCWRPLPAGYKCNRFTVPTPPPKQS